MFGQLTASQEPVIYYIKHYSFIFLIDTTVLTAAGDVCLAGRYGKGFQIDISTAGNNPEKAREVLHTHTHTHTYTHV
jgi:hypothetical protein